MTFNPEPRRASALDYEWLVTQQPHISEGDLDAIARRYADAIDAQIIESYIKGKKVPRV